jgi:hypothetical protein
MMPGRKKLLLIFLFPAISFGQEPVVAAAGVSAGSAVDTNYIHFYKDKLIIGLWQSERQYEIGISEKLKPDTGKSAINYVALANHVTGFSLDYDIISFSLGFRAIPQGNSRTGKTDYLDLSLNFNTRGFRFENSYRQYKGFYDNNTADYTVPFTDTVPYFQNPSMFLQTLRSKMIYNFNRKKFTLGAPYGNAKRQLKSAGSWMLVANFYGFFLNTDSSFIPPPIQSYYGLVWDGLHKMNIYAYSMGPGGSYTFVIWKKVYLNFLVSFGLERQYRHFYVRPENIHYSYWQTWFTADWRTSLGYNGKRFFLRISNFIEGSAYNGKDLYIDSRLVAGSVDFGYRFNFKPPKPYRWFQSTKIYKWVA